MKATVKFSRTLAAGALAIGVLITGAIKNIQAAVVINAIETGSDVVFSGSGTLDISNLTPQGSGNLLAGIDFGAEVFLGGDPTGFPPVDFYGAEGELTSPPVFGADQFTIASLGTGPRMGIAVEAFAMQTAPAVTVPAGYVSGDPLSSTSTYSGKTFASLGLEPGTYVWSWSDDSVTLNIGQEPVAKEVDITCRDLGHFGANECSVAELTSGGGRVFVLNVAMTVNTSPVEPENDRVKVTGFIEEGSNRPGLRFEVFEDALAVDVCNDLPLYSFGSFVFERSLSEPIEITDATLSIDYSDVHTGSGENFDGAFLYGFIMDAPFFTSAEEVGVDFFIPEAARDARNSEDNSFLDVFGPAEVLPVTLVFDPEKFDPMNPGRQDFRVDILQRAAPANSPLCGQITRVNGWTVTFGRAGDPDPTPQQVNITPLILPLLLP